MADGAPCAGCGEAPVVVEELGGRRYFMSMCRCPKARCFSCENVVDGEGRCTTTLCFMDGLAVPIPVTR